MFGTATLASAAIIGTNPPALPLTAERIAALPKNEQPAWKKYLERSARQLQADRRFLSNEMKSHGLKGTLMPPAGNSVNWTGLRPRSSSGSSFARAT